MTLTGRYLDRYLDRIGFGDPIAHDLATLTALQQAHLSTVAFENLDVFSRVPVRTDTDWSVSKIVDRHRGGWCFENNGAFGWLLDQLGFPVFTLGAAVLLGGPNKIIDHATLEVQLDRPYLVDVGFGDSFSIPLALNQAGPQDGGTGTFEFLPSPEGVTLAEHVDGLPEARYRFRRVAHPMIDFDEVSGRLQADETAHWRKLPFATRLIDGGPDRVTLLADRLKLRRGDVMTEDPVSPHDWDDVLWEWFEILSPTRTPPTPPRS